MPELPEVQTTVDGLNKVIKGKTIVDFWSDWPKTIKKPTIKEFERNIKGKKVVRAWRRAKNVIIDLSGNYSLLIHQKMTGHLLVGKWELENKEFKPKDKKGPLADPYNRFLHNMFFFQGGLMMALSDSRKFAKIELWEKKDLLNSKVFSSLGPEPLEKQFSLEEFNKVIKKKKGKVKQVIMIPEVIAGIGNIYASEALWEAKIHPEKNTASLSKKETALLYKAIKKVLSLGVKFGGVSFSDYRKVDGSKGEFGLETKVYQRDGQKCPRCKTKIERSKHGGRSTFFCPKCQKL